MTSDRTEQVRALRAAGRSMTGVGAELGLTKGQVAGILHRQRHPKPVPRLPPPPPPRPPWYADCAGPGACNWPISEGRPWRFCLRDKEPGGVYCAVHRRLASGGTRYQAAAE